MISYGFAMPSWNKICEGLNWILKQRGRKINPVAEFEMQLFLIINEENSQTQWEILKILEQLCIF